MEQRRGLVLRQGFTRAWIPDEIGASEAPKARAWEYYGPPPMTGSESVDESRVGVTVVETAEYERVSSGSSTRPREVRDSHSFRLDSRGPQQVSAVQVRSDR